MDTPEDDLHIKLMPEKKIMEHIIEKYVSRCENEKSNDEKQVDVCIRICV